jgi:glycosyltransferase involved in cell wall biosynthesis
VLIIYQSTKAISIEMKKITIGIDIREATRKEKAGKGRYCEEITRALLNLPETKSHKFLLFTDEFTDEAENHAENSELLKKFTNFPHAKLVKIPGRGLRWHLALRRHLKKRQRQNQPVDFFLATTSFIYPAIAPKSQKLAITVHDLITFLYAREHSLFATLVERFTLGRAIKKSDFILTISKNTWKDLGRIKSAAKFKPCALAPPAITDHFQPTKGKTLDLPGRYLLAVGTLLPRKNFPAAFRAFAKIAHDQADLHLCIVGGKGWQTSKIMDAVPQNLKNRIHFLGYTPHAQLPEIYSRAQMLLFPSLYEGFGIPPLEAMACGCPVIVSSNSSLPEVVGEAAMQIDPNSPVADIELAEAILAMLDPETQQKYRTAGLAQSKKFSWEYSAKQVLKAIHDAL